MLDDYTAKMLGINLGYSQGLEYALNDDNTLTVTGIGTCHDARIIIPNKYADLNVTAIGHKAFYKCDWIESFKIPEGIKKIEQYAFSGCINITGITLPNSVTTIESFAFYDCERLEGVSIDSIYSQLQRIEQFAFYECRNLRNIILPFKLELIEESVFESCDSLFSISIPSNVKTISESTFYACSNLHTIYMGIGVKKIGSHALGRCESLQTIKFDAKRMHWENINKDEMWDFETPNFIIHCKDGKIKNKYNRW